jgi:EmrB/QacA subfamily drug resistance transporter
MGTRIDARYATALAVAGAIMIQVLDATMFNVALASVIADLGVGLNDIQWLVTTPTVIAAAAMPIAGYLANRFGARRLFLAALGFFALGGVVGALVPALAPADARLAMLVAAQVGQGFGGGLLMPVGSAIAFGGFAPADRAASTVIVGLPVLVGFLLGPLLGGLIVDGPLGWPGVFWLSVVLSAAAAVAVVRVIRRDPPRAATAGDVDVLGLGLVLGGVLALVYALAQIGEAQPDSAAPNNPAGAIVDWGSWQVWTALLLGVVLLALFAHRQLAAADPVLDLRLFAQRDFRGASILTWLTRVVAFSGVFLVPLYLQQSGRFTAQETGLLLTGSGLGMIVGVPSGGFLFDRLGPRFLVAAGLLSAAVSAGALAGLGDGVPTAVLWGALALGGIGFGWTSLPLQTAALAAFTGHALAPATSLYSVTAQIAGAAGTALVTTLLVVRTAAHATAQDAAGAATGDVFVALAAGSVVALAMAFALLPRYSLRQQQQQQEQQQRDQNRAQLAEAAVPRPHSAAIEGPRPAAPGQDG